MGMNDVVRASFTFDLFDELLGELVEMLVDRHLRPVPQRPGLNVDHPSVRPESLYPRVVLLPPAREDVDLDATATDIARELAYVNVHSAGVAAPELGQRARMDREHRDAADHDLAAT